jgi:hypothetical protein
VVELRDRLAPEVPGLGRVVPRDRVLALAPAQQDVDLLAADDARAGKSSNAGATPLTWTPFAWNHASASSIRASRAFASGSVDPDALPASSARASCWSSATSPATSPMRRCASGSSAEASSKVKVVATPRV